MVESRTISPALEFDAIAYLRSLRPQTRRPVLPRSARPRLRGGAHSFAQRGQEGEFMELRPFGVGDDVRRIDWRVSARRQSLHVRQNEQSRGFRLGIGVDLGASMFTGSKRLRAFSAAEAALSLMHASQIRCTQWDIHIRARNALHSDSPSVSTMALNRCAHALQRHVDVALDQGPQPSATDTRSHWLHSLRQSLARCDTWILISGLDDIDESTLRACTERQPRFALWQISDPLQEIPLSSGTYRFRTEHGDYTAHVDRRQAKAIAATLQQRQLQLQERCRTAGVMLHINTINTAEALAQLHARQYLP